MAIEFHVRELARDPFARTTVVRRLEAEGTARECSWCGRIRRSSKGTPRPAFNYGTQHDGGRTEWSAKPFCSQDCSRVYHGA